MIKWYHIVILIVLFLIISTISEGFSNNYDKEEMFDNLMRNFRTIFPNGNRNAGGSQFYKYISTELNLSREEFEIYNQFYCGVSGSPIDPRRSVNNNHIVIDGLNGEQYYGKYYRCCTPCLCDLMRYSKVERNTIELNDGPYEHYVITIDDPCVREDEIPNQVSSFICQDNKTENGIHTDSGRLIVGVLHEVTLYNGGDVDGDAYCNNRICQEPENLRGGMGDIFVLLSLVGNNGTPEVPERFTCSEPFANEMLNIYGERLVKCREYSNSDDTNGSWDNDGYCSELGGGVHQICFKVDDNTKDFASDTDQSVNWSEDRKDKNHCMCIGAWALYKAKQNQFNNMIPETFDELKCESIPDISISEQYLNNWATWNGNELPNQIVDGVNKLVEQCYNKGNDNQKNYLKDLYLSLVDGKDEFINNILTLE
jgi:hypothetical protein